MNKNKRFYNVMKICRVEWTWKCETSFYFLTLCAYALKFYDSTHRICVSAIYCYSRFFAFIANAVDDIHIVKNNFAIYFPDHSCVLLLRNVVHSPTILSISIQYNALSQRYHVSET